jgi:enoyl-CoA hydratase/3-hydroxyacyl-CoA dehydrogenase
VFSIAKQMVLTERVCSVEDCDLGARVGLRWKKGPFEMMGESPQFVSSSISENIGKITLNRPDSLNALNETMIVELRRHFDTLAHNESVQGIVIEGRGKAFVAGADTHFFVEQIEQNKVARIVEFATSAQALFHDIDQCAKPVVCCIDGLALGGGFELALACDYIVASPRAAVGFPETGIGIYPGLGGTQRTPRRIGIPLSRWMILSGEIVDSNTAHQVGLFDDVIERDQLTKRAIELARQPLPKAIRNANWELPDAFKMIAETYRSPLSSLAETQKRLAGKAPLALAHADELIRATQSRSLNDGLAAELGGLARIFATKDALTGLSSIGKHKPIFEGV